MMKADDLIRYGKALKRIEADGRKIDIEITVVNTGITEKPSSQGFTEYVDLGGRVANIRVEVHNKTLLEVLAHKDKT